MANDDYGSERTVSATEPDWSRERPVRWWDPGARLLATLRAYQRLRAAGGPINRLRSKFVVLRYRFWSVISGADIPLETQIEGGLRMPHPNGIVVHPASRIGPNCLLMQQVTLGVTGRGGGAPVIGGHVEVGAGAKVLGGVRIGDDARVGANAVVVRDVPPGMTAVGIPARVFPNSTPKKSKPQTDVQEVSGR